MSVSDHCQRAVTLLGATGSIGSSTIDVCAHLGIPIHAVTANSKVSKLAALAVQAKAKVAVIADPTRYDALVRALAGSSVRAAAGAEALDEVSADPAVGTVITAIVGAAGLRPTLAAVRAGKRVGIANKEPLVMAGALIMGEAQRYGATILPVDSEHSAIFQCLEGHRGDEVANIILTASGGPFRTVQNLSEVTREQALRHPTWEMGPKITIDSATLMNKSLEVIEARWLFGVEVERIQVLIHPQSVVHSMVAYRDGSVMAQLGRPDMRTPIQYALTWPHHVAGPVEAPDFAKLAAFTFEKPDTVRFPSLTMAYDATRAGGVAPAVMNAANEMAVARFLAGHGRFIDIFATVAEALNSAPRIADPDLDTIIAADADVRRRLAG